MTPSRIITIRIDRPIVGPLICTIDVIPLTYGVHDGEAFAKVFNIQHYDGKASVWDEVKDYLAQMVEYL
jgi:hypothetical protein